MSDLWISDRVSIPAGELHESFARSGGPGGQHVNKTETKVVLRWNVHESQALSEDDRAWLLERLKVSSTGELVVSSEKTRDQSRNREDAREKLAREVAQALVRPTPRKRKRPPKRAKENRLADKKRRSEKKSLRKPPES